MKRSIQAMEILTLTKLKERGFPFFWSLPNSNALINGNISLMVTPLLWHWYFDFSGLSRESSFLIWTAFTSGLQGIFTSNDQIISATV